MYIKLIWKVHFSLSVKVYLFAFFLFFFQIATARPTFKNLFVPAAQPRMTVRRLLGIFKPQFSDDGTNQLVEEKKVYDRFVQYVKEVYGELLWFLLIYDDTL